MVPLETQHGKMAMQIFPTLKKPVPLPYVQEYCGQDNTAERKRVKEEEWKDCFVFYSWFGGVDIAANQLEAIHEDKEGLPAGHESIVAVKQKAIPKERVGAFDERVAKWLLYLSCM
jgi:hypothetical protein